MAILTPEKTEALRNAARHPVKFMKGNDLPPEQVRPWELGTHIISGLRGLRVGFEWSNLWLFQNVFRMQPAQQAIAQVPQQIFDGLNDPIIGSYMDTKSWPLNIHRWIVRFGSMFSSLLVMIPFFYFGGLSHWQRIILYIVCLSLRSIFATPAAVSTNKIIAHTATADQRRKINWAQGLGQMVHEMLVPLFWALIGLRDVFGWSEYNIIITVLLVGTIPNILLDWGPTFVIQRIPDHVQPPASNATGVRGLLLEIVEAFRVTRHNKYFWLDNFMSLFHAFIPTVSEGDFYRFSNVDEIVGLRDGNGNLMRGEALLFARDNLVSIHPNLIVPFALPIINKVGGPRNIQLLHESIRFVGNLARALVGVTTRGGWLFHSGMEATIRTLGRTQEIGGRMNQFDMLDFVEWKTGRRTEGAVMAIEGLKRKMITNNISATVGRLFLQFVLGFDAERGHGRGDGLPGQSETYMRYMPMLYLWAPVLHSAISVIARYLYRYPLELRDKVEADLAERRRLAEEAKAALEEEQRETAGVGSDE